MDMFREPKFAAYAYASQCEPSEEVILKPVTFWARGERNIGGVLPLIILTNCDEVELRYGDHPPKRIGPDRENFPHLPHPPVVARPPPLHPRGARPAGACSGRMRPSPATSAASRSRRCASSPIRSPTTLEVVADRDDDRATADDSVRVMVRALDQAGNKLPFLLEPVEIEVERRRPSASARRWCRCAAARPASGSSRPARRADHASTSPARASARPPSH